MHVVSTFANGNTNADTDHFHDGCDYDGYHSDKIVVRFPIEGFTRKRKVLT